MKTFENNRKIKHGAVKVLINAGTPAREAFAMLENGMPHLFFGFTKCREIDNSWKELMN